MDIGDPEAGLVASAVRIDPEGAGVGLDEDPVTQVPLIPGYVFRLRAGGCENDNRPVAKGCEQGPHAVGGGVAYDGDDSLLVAGAGSVGGLEYEGVVSEVRVEVRGRVGRPVNGRSVTEVPFK